MDINELRTLYRETISLIPTEVVRGIEETLINLVKRGWRHVTITTEQDQWPQGMEKKDRAELIADHFALKGFTTDVITSDGNSFFVKLSGWDTPPEKVMPKNAALAEELTLADLGFPEPRPAPPSSLPRNVLKFSETKRKPVKSEEPPEPPRVA